MDEIDIESRGAGSASGQGSKASLRARLAALTALLLAGASLSACGSGRIFDGTTYAGDIQPQSTARITPPDVEEPEFEWPEPGESQLEAASSGAEAAQGPALPSELLAGQGGSAGSEPIETPRAAPASPVEATAVEAPPPPAASPPPPAASPPPPAASPPPPPPLAAPPPPPVSAPPPQPTPAPSPTASATQSQPAPALTALPRPASPEAFPNLADVPERPADVPSPQERASLAAELEQDRASNLGGERPVAPVGGLPAPTGPVPTGGITFGAPAQTTAATPVPTPAPTTPAGPLATIRFAEGSTAVPTEAEGTLRSVARTAAASGATLTVLGRVPTQATDSDALRLANSVAGILLREGMSPLKVIVQGRADIEDGGPLVVVLPQN